MAPHGACLVFPLKMIMSGRMSPFALQQSTSVRCHFSTPVVLTCAVLLPLTSIVLPGTMSKKTGVSFMFPNKAWTISVLLWVEHTWSLKAWILGPSEGSGPWMCMRAWQGYGALLFPSIRRLESRVSFADCHLGLLLEHLSWHCQLKLTFLQELLQNFILNFFVIGDLSSLSLLMFPPSSLNFVQSFVAPMLNILSGNSKVSSSQSHPMHSCILSATFCSADIYWFACTAGLLRQRLLEQTISKTWEVLF